MIILSPFVYSLGIGVPSSISEGFEMDTGDEVDIVFSIRGDELDNDIVFFIHQDASQDRALEFEGDYVYSDDMNIDAFENEDVEIEVYAENSGVHIVYYGYKIEADGSGMGIDSIVQNKFMITVDGQDLNPNNDTHNNESDDDFQETGGGIDIVVGSTSSSSGGSSRGSGGSRGAGYLPLSDEPEEQSDSSGDEANIQDISAQGSSLTEMSVDTSEEKRTITNPFASNKESLSENTNDDGEKRILLYLVLIGAVACLVNIWAIGNLVGDGDEK